jgi:cation:H+ antiporter
MQLLLNVLALIVGFVFLIKGADWLVDSASDIATRLKIPQIVIGLTICAFGTSLPEASVSITAALNNSADISIGNIVGSNIINILLILGITALITDIPIEKSAQKVDIPFILFISLVLLVEGILGNSVNRIDGVILWLIFIAYLAYLFIKTSKESKNQTVSQDEENTQDKLQKLPVTIFFLLIGLVTIVAGSNLTVDSATYIAKYFGMSERFIALTLCAFGTSLPELVTSAVAAIKHKSDIAVGNIVGSNIFNILFVIGTTSILTPVAFSDSFIIDLIISIFAAVLLFVLTLRKGRLTRWHGAVFLVCYAAYLGYLICK